MSALVDYGDLSEWSLFGDQMLITSDLGGDIPFDADSGLLENLVDSDSSNMADWISDSKIACLSGVTTTLKVLSAADEDQYTTNDLDSEENDKWSGVAASDTCSDFEESVNQLNSNAAISCLLINNDLDTECHLPDASLSPCLVFDGVDGPFMSLVAACASDDVSVEEEYIEIELKNETECDDAEMIMAADSEVILNLVGLDGCHSVCLSEDESSLSGSSSYDADNLGSAVESCWSVNGLSGSMVFDSDRRLRKKEQNKSAAMRYRLKKRVERGSMQSELESLRKRNVELKTKVEQMTRELGYLKELVDELDVLN